MKPGKSHKKAFILFPVLFFAVGYLLLYLAFLPVLGTAASAADLVFFNGSSQPDKQLGNIFTSAPETNAKTVKKSQITFPEYGTKFGRLVISSASVKTDLYFGDGAQELKNGVGLYNGSFIPGYGRTILIAGHNHTYFHTLGSAKIGDIIQIETNYGRYEYRITKSQVKPASDKTAYDLSNENENLILYTCYPFDCIGLTPQRYYVYAQFVSGPIIDKQG
jgi:sortase A